MTYKKRFGGEVWNNLWLVYQVTDYSEKLVKTFKTEKAADSWIAKHK